MSANSAVVVQPRLVTEDQALTKPAALDLVAIAADPNVSVEKLERLMAMQERMIARVAEEKFNASMSAVQTKMRPIAADADNPQTRSKYASYAALDVKLRPIYTEGGFGLSFDTGDSGASDLVRVLCYVTHRDGFARTYHVDMPNDGKGAKGGDVMTKTHATGAAMSYGMRYLLKMIFNVAVGEDDTDGNEQPTRPEVKAPAGFEDWWEDLRSVAADGQAALEKAWQQSKGEYKGHLTRTNARGWQALKVAAAKVKVSQ